VTDDVLSQVEQSLCASFGSVPARATTSFVGVEPIEVLRFSSPDVISYVSLGLSRRPMSAADSYLADESGPRAELLVQTRRDAGELWRRLAVLAAAPVVEGVVYSAGMTVEVGAPLDGSSICVGGVIVESALPALDTAVGAVSVLRVLPATSTELAYSRVHGSAALLALWEAAGTDLLELSRGAVELT
jgi:hypothetical protein